ncbi:MAG: DUF2974 domain-containing protein [Firmicutes bacterium]|nr:DUF2974 domain-containing protein [Bacillota bacterium]
MDRLTDYIAWLGDVDFDAKPLNEVDALIMCVISYFDLGPAMDPNGGIFYLKDCVRVENSGKLGLKITGGDLGNSDIFKAAAESKRFGELVITRFVDQLDPGKDLQFSAVVLSWKDKFSFIAYRGTDDTLVGWKEDFMIAYTRTQAQKLAAEYAKASINEKPGTKTGKLPASLMGKKSRNENKLWYIGGHSKGANLAMYAACMLSDRDLSKVERVFVLDGPGSAPEVLDPGLLKRIDAKTTRIIPEYSVIGRLMEPQLSNTLIVESAFDGFMQHSLASWGVYHGGPALSEMTEPKDRWINETLRKWIEGMPVETRETFVNELFAGLMAGGAQTVPELMSGGLAGLESVLKSFSGFSDTTKEILSQLKSAALAELKDTTLSGIKEAAIDTASAALTGIKEAAKGGAGVVLDAAGAALSGIKEVAADGASVAIEGASAAFDSAKKAIGNILNIEKKLDAEIAASEAGAEPEDASSRVNGA